jgi:tRNA1Val (adenine37-N6)-methyltransferase
VTDFTQDCFLGDKVRVRQPARGFRSGLDAVLLAAAVPARSGDEILELGAGSGAGSLCLAARVRGCAIAGVEVDPDLAQLANDNAASNGLTKRLHFVAADIFALPKTLRRSFDHVLCNPPFHGGSGARPPESARARALHDDGQLAVWLEVGMKRVGSRGTFTTIVRADRLTEALGALPDRGVSILPLWPRADEPAKRVILRARPGSRAPLKLLPGLVLHEKDGRYTRQADAVLRDGRALPID